MRPRSPGCSTRPVSSPSTSAAWCRAGACSRSGARCRRTTSSPSAQISHAHRDPPRRRPLENAQTGMRRHCHEATVMTGYRRGRRLAAGGYDEAPGQVSFHALPVPEVCTHNDATDPDGRRFPAWPRHGGDLTDRRAITRFPPRFSADDGIVSASDRGLYAKAAGTNSQTGKPAFSSTPGIVRRTRSRVSTQFSARSFRSASGCGAGRSAPPRSRSAVL